MGGSFKNEFSPLYCCVNTVKFNIFNMLLILSFCQKRHVIFSPVYWFYLKKTTTLSFYLATREQIMTLIINFEIGPLSYHFPKIIIPHINLSVKSNPQTSIGAIITAHYSIIRMYTHMLYQTFINYCFCYDKWLG